MSLFRPDVERLAGYVPGEQPQESGWVKLNTNENPYSPSPSVLEAVHAAASGRLNVYPDPLASAYRKAVADVAGVDPACVLPANGSDENLTILLRSFVDAGELVAYPYPSYILYETLAEIQGARFERIHLRSDWSWDWDAAIAVAQRAKIVFVPNPNSPSGNRWTSDELLRLMPANGVLVIDEAYGDFCDEPASCELLDSDVGDRIVYTRTLSKSYSLAGIRSGFAIARPELIDGMRKVKDSYNCNSLTLAAGLAAIEDQDWMKSNTQHIRQTRERLTQELRAIGFDVVPSQANFVWATCDSSDSKIRRTHAEIFEELKQRRILIRYMKFDAPDSTIDGLRITIGTDEEVDMFLNAIREIVVA
ncbi:MAG: histidinol-phosphate transaminase [Planctomycetaceae bacterium]|nr:histidinol-phosphate transaminase [Planctomycetaceae bacterium]